MRQAKAVRPRRSRIRAANDPEVVRLTDDEILEGIQDAIARANQLLVTYLARHIDDPVLIGVCQNPKCPLPDRRFDMRRSDQRFCSATCRAQAHYYKRYR